MLRCVQIGIVPLLAVGVLMVPDAMPISIPIATGPADFVGLACRVTGKLGTGLNELTGQEPAPAGRCGTR